MRRGILIEADATARLVCLPEENEEGSLSALQSLVGGWIELVPTPHAFPFTLFGNEEAKLNNMPRNWTATAFSQLFPHDIVCGPVVVLGRCDENGCTLGLSEEQAGRLLAMLSDPETEKLAHATVTVI